MLKYLYTNVVFQEVPEEISLAISITNCPHHCPGCHSPELQSDKGQLLTPESLTKLIEENSGISCVCFMGGEFDIDTLHQLVGVVRKFQLKSALYSGSTLLPIGWQVFNYIKLGPYLKHLGPLTSKTTNQRFYKITSNELIDLTYKFNGQRYSD